MTKFIIKRLALSVVIFFFVMLIVYTLMYCLPTSFVEAKARELASQPGNKKSAAQWLEDLSADYGMNKGLLPGYLTWLGNAARGDFGDSWKWTISVTAKFREVIWYSFYLGLASFVLYMAISIPLGVLAARKQYSIADYTITVVSLIGISMPTFFVATLLKLVFSVNLGWFDLSGMQSRNYLSLSELGKILDVAKHYVLPTLTIVIINIGSMMRYTRTNTLEVLNADYIRTARAKGLPESKVIGYHAFRNTLIPIVTVIGNSLPNLFAGALITETLFSVKGIGYTSYHSMVNGDIPFTMFYLAFIAILTLLGTLLADILYAVVDPRVRVN